MNVGSVCTVVVPDGSTIGLLTLSVENCASVASEVSWYVRLAAPREFLSLSINSRAFNVGPLLQLQPQLLRSLSTALAAVAAAAAVRVPPNRLA